MHLLYGRHALCICRCRQMLRLVFCRKSTSCHAPRYARGNAVIYIHVHTHAHFTPRKRVTDMLARTETSPGVAIPATSNTSHFIGDMSCSSARCKMSDLRVEFLLKTDSRNIFSLTIQRLATLRIRRLTALQMSSLDVCILWHPQGRMFVLKLSQINTNERVATSTATIHC